MAEEAEYDDILKMTQEAFRKASDGRSTGEFESNIVEATTINDPNFHEGDLRVVEAEGRIASMMLIVRRQARIGKATVNNAIISPVATRVGEERKGYCSAVMRDAIEYMRRQEFDITTLWGHPWLYTHYGYSAAMVGPSIAIKPERCKPIDIGETFKICTFEETQAKSVTDIYHRNTADQILATVRHPEPFEWKVHSPNVEFYTLVDKKGDVRGYYSLSQTASPSKQILEIGVNDEETCKEIFNRLLGYAKEAKPAEVICPMSPKHPFAQFAYWRNAEIRITMASGAGMVLILDVIRLFHKLEAEFDERLNYSEFSRKPLSLTIQTEKEAITLALDKAGIAVTTSEDKVDYTLETPLSALNQLFTGYKDIHRLLDEEAVRIDNNRTDGGDSSALIELVNVLFPKSTPYDYHLPLVWE